MKYGTLILFSSPNGRDEWAAVAKDAWPEWVKDPDTMGQLVGGDMACDASANDPLWYRAEQVKDE